VESRSRSPLFIKCEQDDSQSQIETIMKHLDVFGVKNPSLSISIDGTAMAQIREVLKAHGVIMGGAYLNHLINIPDGTDQLQAILKDDNIDIAQEVKIAVVSLQANPPGVLTSWTQTPPYKYQVFTCSYDARKATMKLPTSIWRSWKLLNKPSRPPSIPFVLLNCAHNGVSCDSEFVMDGLINFLSGKKLWLTMTDPNHNNKTFNIKP
jgi:hypothetical protein